MKEASKVIEGEENTFYIFAFDMEAPMNSIKGKESSKRVNKDMIKVGFTKDIKRRVKEYKNTYKSNDASKSHAILKYEKNTKKNESECRVIERMIKSEFNDFHIFGEYYDKKVFKKIKIFLENRLENLEEPLANTGEVDEKKIIQYDENFMSNIPPEEYENCVFFKTDLEGGRHPLNIARRWWIGNKKKGRTFNEINAPDSFYKRCLKEHGHGNNIKPHLRYDIKKGFIEAKKKLRTESFELKRDRPIPTDIKPRNNRWNLHLMDIGDSLEIAYDSVEAQRLRVAICNYARRNDKRFITRREDDRLIVWRVE